MNRRGRVERVVVLDLDDTLYLEKTYVASGFEAVGRWARSAIGIHGFETRLHTVFAEGVRGRVFDAALEQAGLAVNPTLIARMVSAYRQHAPKIELEPDSLRLLARRTEGTRFALITDGPLDSQRRKIRALGLNRHVDLAICTDRWGRADWKPSPRAFRMIESLYALPADRFTYVADNPAKDFSAPIGLGWNTIWIKRIGKIDRPDPERLAQYTSSVGNLDGLAV